MKNKKSKLFIVLLLLIVITLSSCISTTTIEIDSTPQGADIYLDGEKVGKTPLIMEMSNAIGKNNPKVILKKKGYNNLEGRLEHELQKSNLIYGIFWWSSLFYTSAPISYQNFKLKKEE